VKEGHLRWDSLGEYLALTVALEDLGKKTDNDKILILSKALDKAVEKVLFNGKSPSRKVNEIDNRGGHFYLALYWAEELANQDDDKEIKEKFAKVYAQLKENEDKINEELLAAQGAPVDMEGYYRPDFSILDKQMRPSETLNTIIDGI
jgi:isocitrate dehydrogenase